MRRTLLLALALALAGCLAQERDPLPEGPPDLVLADSVAVLNASHLALPLAGNGSGEWVVQVRALQGSPLWFWLATPGEAEAFGTANFSAVDSLPHNVEGRLRGSFPDGQAVLILDNTGLGPPSWAPGGGVLVSWRASFWERDT